MPVCRPYLLRQRLGITSPFYKGHVRAHVDTQKCTGCGTCQEVCPFAVAKLDSGTNFAEINAAACYGCGTCHRHCPENAITLNPVDNTIQF
jgi:heterodisulfide reductase subunit A-like polyferredoxin